MAAHPAVVGIAGSYKICAEPFDVAGSKAVVDCAPAKEVAKAADEEEIDEDDLFGDDDEDEAAAAEARDVAAQLRGKAFEAKKKAAQEAAGKVVIAKSLILWEVKPLDD